jgi:hypothetical protein
MVTVLDDDVLCRIRSRDLTGSLSGAGLKTGDRA